MFVGIAQKNGIASFGSIPPSGWVSLIVSLLPLATTPLAVAALPLTTASAPTMFEMKATTGDCIFGFRSRLIAYAKFAAVTVCPLLNL